MKFSVDQESISDIIFALTSYSDDIDSEFRKFEDEIIKIAIKTNYNKLLYALQGIIDIYNDVICGSMRKQLIAQWLEEGESLHSFAEDVYMGEESEEAVKKIENSLEEIFIKHSDNNLVELEFSGDSNATREDFDDAVRVFESFALEVERIKDSNSDYFDSRVEDNELYRFLIPIIESIAVGVSSFSSTARSELDRLGENYVERMEGAKQRVEEAKKEKTSVDFDLDLFDFDDDFVSVGTISNTSGSSVNSSSDVQKNESRSIEHIKNIGRRMQQDFASMRVDRKPIEQIIEYANADNLERHLREFSSDRCKWNFQIMKGFKEDILRLNKKRDEAILYQNIRFTKLKENYYKQLEKDLEIAKKDLERRYVKRTISKLIGVNLYQESVNRANQLWNTKLIQLQNEYNEEMLRINSIYSSEKEDIESRKEESYSEGAISQCRLLYKEKASLSDRVRENEQRIISKVKKIVTQIAETCESPCDRLSRIYQDVCLKSQPSILGFYSCVLDHRIAVNEKKKSWLESNNVQEIYDGILNMKTPVHEYLHYLSKGKGKTTGVKNVDVINGIQDENEQKTMRRALTGFNEGITEMFARDYLLSEINENYDFKNENSHLASTKKILRPNNSYDPQVTVIRGIVRVLGDDKLVREAYINHDFSMLMDEIDKKKKDKINRESVIESMSELQRLYTVGTKESYARCIDLSNAIVALLEG